MPAKSVSGISEGKGPAILMEPEDHVLTSSYGYSQEAIAYRATIKQMIAEGRIRDAMAAEIRDVRRVAQENQGSPSYYNTEVMEMLDYAKQAGYLDKK